MPSKGEVEAKRQAATRRLAAQSGIRIAVREALEAGLSAEDMAKEFAAVLRESGLLGTAAEVVTTARAARKK